MIYKKYNDTTDIIYKVALDEIIGIKYEKGNYYQNISAGISVARAIEHINKIYKKNKADFIVTNKKQIIYSKVLSYNNDSITYLLTSDSTNKLHSISNEKVYGIRFLNDNCYKISEENYSVKRFIIEINRTKKQGWHIGVEGLIGGEGLVYEPIYSYSDSTKYYYNFEKRSSFMYYTELSARYYINNTTGLKFGLGSFYNSTETRTTYEYNTFEYGDPTNEVNEVSYSRENEIRYLALPISAFFSPGDKFGLYAELQTSFIIPLSAKYDESLHYVGVESPYEYNGSFKDDIPSIDFLIGGVLGFHATIKKRYNVFVGFNAGTSFREINNFSYVGGRIGINYFINLKE